MNFKKFPNYPITIGVFAMYVVMLIGVVNFTPQVLTNSPWFASTVYRVTGTHTQKNLGHC
jgi:hypothetical protein